MSVLEFLDNIDREDLFWLTLAFVIFAAPAYSIGFIQDVSWLWIIAVIITALFGAFGLTTYFAKKHIKKKEVEALTKAPNFPHIEYCDNCGKSLEGAEERIEGDLRILICPHCNAENVIKGNE